MNMLKAANSRRSLATALVWSCLAARIVSLAAAHADAAPLHHIAHVHGIDAFDTSLDLAYAHLGATGADAILQHLAARAEAAARRRGDAATQECAKDESALADSDVERPTSLCLTECGLGDLGVAELAASPLVIGEEGPAFISFRHNHFGTAGARAIFHALRSAAPHGPKELDLDFNPVGDAGLQPLPSCYGGGGSSGSSTAAAQADQAASPAIAPPLERLSLRFCDVGPSGCRALSSALIKGCLAVPNGGLSALSLAGNSRIGDVGAFALASALRRGCSLRELDLSHCHIGDDGARALASALSSCKTLRSLDLSYNRIAAEGANALATALKSPRCGLEALDLRSNRLGDAGAASIASALSGSRRDFSSVSNLRALNLAGNKIGSEGAGALARALRRGGRTRGGAVLEELDLSGNVLAASAAAAAVPLRTRAAAGAISSITRLYSALMDAVDGGQEAPIAAAAASACGLAALAEALERSESLQKVWLTDVGMGPEEARVLADALQKHRGLLTEVVAEDSRRSVSVRDLSTIASALARTVRRRRQLSSGGGGVNAEAEEGTGDGSLAAELGNDLASLLAHEAREKVFEGDAQEIEVTSVRRRRQSRGAGAASVVVSEGASISKSGVGGGKASVAALAKRVSRDGSEASASAVFATAEFEEETAFEEESAERFLGLHHAESSTDAAEADVAWSVTGAAGSEYDSENLSEGSASGEEDMENGSESDVQEDDEDGIGSEWARRSSSGGEGEGEALGAAMMYSDEEADGIAGFPSGASGGANGGASEFVEGDDVDDESWAS